MRQLGAVVARLGGLAVVRMQLSVVSTELVTADTELHRAGHSCTSAFLPDNMPTCQHAAIKYDAILSISEENFLHRRESMTVFGHHVQIVLLNLPVPHDNCSVLIVLVAAFEKEKALVGAFSVITNLRVDLRLKSAGTLSTLCQ